MPVENIGLHDLHLEDLQNPHHPSLFEEHQNYTILVLRLPEQIAHAPKIRSYGFIITGSAVYSYDIKKDELAPFPDGMDGMYRFLDAKIDALMVAIEEISEEILSLEENLYKKLSPLFMNRWHDLKKELTRSERLLRKAVEILERFIAKTKVSVHFLHNEFNDLHEHLERSLRAIAAANEQLDNLYHYYNLRSSDRMNRSIYLLTVISVIFLPLNLVVGFFGMNTGGLPFQNHPMGTAYAFGSMITFGTLLAIAVLWRIKNE